jgi:NAD(P)-dependent dehydrogenase (short-subunit alcohol dehydrogenase family)
MPTILIVGATRGLGAALANLYASSPSNTVFGTTRSASNPTYASHAHGKEKFNEKITWLKDIDLQEKDVGKRLVNQFSLVGGGGGMVEGGVNKIDVLVC